jgi:DNA-directed RNA polymerase specialized sigma24 family protein
MSVSFAMIHATIRVNRAASRSGNVDVAAPDLDAVYRAEIRRMIGLASVLTGSRSAGEGLAHDAFLLVLRRVEHDAGYLRSPAWPLLRTVIVRLAIQRRGAIAREARRLALFWESPDHEWWDPDPTLIDWHVALGALPPRMRACAVLFYGEDMSVADVARALQRSPRTVEHQLEAARFKLAQALRARRGEDTAS